MQLDLISTIVFLPLLGAGLLVVLPRANRDLARAVALGVSLATLALAVYLFIVYQNGSCSVLTLPAALTPTLAGPRVLLPSPAAFQCENYAPFFPLLGASWHVGVDGLGLAMVLMTAILTPLAILISWDVGDRLNEFLALLLVMEMSVMGVFVSLDLLMFFIFYELSIVPTFFLINQWGGPNRKAASFKFFLYIMAGSLGLLLSIQMIGALSGTFDLRALLTTWPNNLNMHGQTIGTPFGMSLETVKLIAFGAISLAFGLKTPIWPLHTWLPDTQEQAPTAASMLLFKVGAFGFLRLAIPLFPAQAQQWAPVLAILATIGIIMGALSAYGQTSLRRLIAYSTVGHMGFVALGIAAFASVYNTILTKTAVPDLIQITRSVTLATNGAILQMFTHGLTAAAMFLLSGALFRKTQTDDLTRFGGLWGLAPAYGALLVFTGMASLGLPGLSDFVGEFQLVAGSWWIFPFYVALAMIGLLIGGAYILKVIQKILQGPIREEWIGYRLEITRLELVAMAPLVVITVVTGLYPNWIVTAINATVTRLFG